MFSTHYRQIFSGCFCSPSNYTNEFSGLLQFMVHSNIQHHNIFEADAKRKIANWPSSNNAFAGKSILNNHVKGCQYIFYVIVSVLSHTECVCVCVGPTVVASHRVRDSNKVYWTGGCRKIIPYTQHSNIISNLSNMYSLEQKMYFKFN